ncbi:MAG: hypothetical protein AAF221_10075 [Pseudomonadota bacterium]
MRKMMGLIRAELLQHRASMIITPLVIAGLIAAFALAQLIFGTAGLNINFGDIDIAIDNDTIVDPQSFQKAGKTIAASFGFIGLPIYFVANLVAFFVMLYALYEERTERTILFFKSMPVSDTQVVLAKYLTASFIGPLIAIVVMILLTLVLSVATATVFSVRGIANIWGFLGDLPLLRLFISFAGYYSLYALWVAPIFAYLLMMSALAPRSPFLLALLPVAIIVLAEAILLGSGWLLNEIGARVIAERLGDAIRASRSLSEAGAQSGFDAFFIRFSDFVMTASAPGFWLGLLCAAGFVAVAIWSRSRKTL